MEMRVALALSTVGREVRHDDLFPTPRPTFRLTIISSHGV